MTTLLTNCHVIPCITEGEAIIHDAAVLIEGKQIKAVGKATDFGDSEGVQIRDLGGRYVMPGLMNMHVHLGLSLPGATQAAAAKETEMDLFARALKNAHDALHAGVTFVRCQITPDNLGEVLGKHLSAGDMLIDLGLGTRVGGQFVLGDLAAANTLLVVVNDNGTLALNVLPPFSPANAKQTVYETGVRSPCIIAGPQVQSPGRAFAFLGTI